MRKAHLLLPGSILLGVLAFTTLRGQQPSPPPAPPFPEKPIIVRPAGEPGEAPAAPKASSGKKAATPSVEKPAAPAIRIPGIDTPIPEKPIIVRPPQAPVAPLTPGVTPVAPVQPGVGTPAPGVQATVLAPRDMPKTGGTSEGIGPATSVIYEAPNAPRPPRNLIDQTWAEANRKSAGCLDCHKDTDAKTMHVSPHVVLGCTDCHGGNPKRGLTLTEAHVKPHNPHFWQTSANPVNATVMLNHESPEFIRFVNPGDLRVSQAACGTCHDDICKRVPTSIMNHGAMLWNAAAYNNGAIQKKNPIVGQAYGADGVPLQLNPPFMPTAEETRKHGWLPVILPLPRFNRGAPGNVFRIFEKGGMEPLFLGSPTLDEPPGKPERRLSQRAYGTLLRVDPTILGAQKTRLHDPMLQFMGSNDHPGDYRSSGCSACHVMYANDRSPTNSGWWSRFGNQGLSFSKDPTISKNERGHPVFHQFTRSIASSQCMNCHMHQGNLFVNPFLGYIWWDQETEGQHMYPKEQHDPTDDELVVKTRMNPEGAVARGLWGDLNFLEKVAELNPKLKQTQFADYHGHGWNFRAVFKKDKKGNLLDLEDNKLPHGDFKNAVHLNDIHLKKGMQCVDCHFEVEVHGNGLLYGEPRNMTTIMCIDCHGTVDARPTLLTTGAGGTWDGKSRKTDPVDLATLSTPFGPRFEWEEDLDPATGGVKNDARGVPVRRLYQNSNMGKGVRWEVPQTYDVVNPLSHRYNAKARYAKTLQRDGVTWGKVPDSPEACAKTLAHSNQAMDCQICHTSWATSCFGCHMPLKANQHVPLNKYEGTLDRNYTTYNPQVVRDDVFQLGIDGTVKKHRMAVIRSSSAVVVSSQNSNREWVYSQIQTVSGDGYSGQAYNPHFAHTTSGKGTTKNCTDCHLSKANDNNAWIASLLGFGTGTVNFFGRYAWIGGDHAIHGVIWTEADEPQSAIGSSFHKNSYPKNYQKHVENGRILKTGYEHHAKMVKDITLRGEYVYTANGSAGFEVFDVANIDQKGFSERMVSSPVSPLGQRTYVRTKNAVAVALPSTLLQDTKRIQDPVNEEQPINKIYGHAFVVDSEEGLVVVNVENLFDGNPENNFLYRVKLQENGESDPKGGFFRIAARSGRDAYNPGGRLTGATYGVMAGSHLYVTTPRGLAVLDVNKVNNPRLVGELVGGLRNPKAVAIQFRYAFVTDDDGLKVVDISNPIRPRLVSGALVPLRHANKLYVARTYAYVANGPQGLAIIDVENPERPSLNQMYTANGQLNDTHSVSIGSVAASMYALVADGHNGLRVLQLISPDTVQGSQGFSPRPAPRLIASYPTSHPTLAVTRGLDRDRVVDETGNQTVVFGRRGSRPFHLDEMRPFLRHANGEWYKVEDVSMKGKKLMTSSGTELVDPFPPPPPAPPVVPGAPGAFPGQPERKLQELDLPMPPPPGAPPGLTPIIPPTKTLQVPPSPEPAPKEPATPPPPATTPPPRPVPVTPRSGPVTPGSLQQSDIPPTRTLIVPPEATPARGKKK